MTISVNTNNAAMIALQNLNKTQNNLGTVQNKISTGLEIVMLKALSKDAAERYQSADAFAEALSKIASLAGRK